MKHPKNNITSAFTLIEMMVVITLIGIVMAVGLPKMMHRRPESELTTVLEDLNNLVFFARQEAISDQKVYRLTFCANKTPPDEVLVEEGVDDPEKPGQTKFQLAASYTIKTRYVLHESVKIKSVFHGKQDDIASDVGKGYCYVIPDGLVQDVVVHVIKKEGKAEFKSSFKMMPFYGTFELSEGFIQPG